MQIGNLIYKSMQKWTETKLKVILNEKDRKISQTHIFNY